MKKFLKNNSYAVLFILFSCLCAGLVSYLSEPANENTYMTITVKEGDSLWAVAGELAERHSMDRSDIINWVKKNNGLASDTIYPGDKIIVPVKKLTISGGQQLASAGGDE
ncbi:cell division suppressor protein YneA [Neobacillus piezotolerans]|uniref:Cell division suppressor protein YneA n=1 Tax=Neobacillus piezotolerans TaxID=2259171 RepID=A0A3D8GWS7_9BACI|nr:LysM peptidoglycan-binding domain-containing protein [Neobacillus piezotolerans]RDU38659.1 cell division suppressor protein YneA [Neobacillus piezotolerans]